MNYEEVGRLLGHLALIDNREVGDGQIAAWHDVLPPELTFDVAYQALIRCMRDPAIAYIGPREIIQAAAQPSEQRQLELDRMARAGAPPIPGGLTIPEERAWRRKWLDAVKAGLSRDDAADAASLEMDLPPEPPALEAARRVEAVNAFGELLARKTEAATA